MALRLTPQKREFFALYSDAAGNAVETAQLLCDLLAVFPADGDRLIAQQVGFDHHLLKPCDPAKLFELLKPLTPL